jgi:plasmid stabilization system protein ParE
MLYRVVISDLAQRDLDSFYEYLRRYSESTARKYVEAFYDAIERTIAVSPHSFSFFSELGAPYKAFLFTVSRRTAFWIIYKINEGNKEVRILRFWNASREPGTHGLNE